MIVLAAAYLIFETYRELSAKGECLELPYRTWTAV